jgi:hypothetical protein
VCLICNVVGGREGREGCEGCPVLYPSPSSSFTRLSNIFLSGDNGDDVGLVSMEMESNTGDDVVGLVSMEMESILWAMLMGGESCIAATGVEGERSIPFRFENGAFFLFL